MLRKHHKYLDRIIVFLLIFVLPIVMTALVEHFITNAKVDPAAYNGVAVAGTMLGVWGGNAWIYDYGIVDHYDVGRW